MAEQPSPEDIATTVHVLKFMSSNKDVFFSSKSRELRKAMEPLHKIVGEKRYGGLTHAEYGTKRALRIEAAGREARRREMDKRHINSVQLRASRVENLRDLLEDGKEEAVAADVAGSTAVAAVLPLIPDGVGSLSSKQGVTDFSGNDVDHKGVPEVSRPRQCYTCKARFTKLHHFYDQLCPECAALNWRKRHRMSDLRGRVALVTGARVKIGFRIVLRLLRCGATVIATTRFPRDAALRYSREADYEEFKGRLHIYGLDFRDIRSIERFADHIERTYDDRGLDIIVHNACQTVRRPASYYSSMLDGEFADMRSIAPALHCVLLGDEQFVQEAAVQSGAGAVLVGGCGTKRARLEDSTSDLNQHRGVGKKERLSQPSVEDQIREGGTRGTTSDGAGKNPHSHEMTTVATTGGAGAAAMVSSGVAGLSGVAAMRSAAKTRIPLMPEDSMACSHPELPEGKSDVNGQQVDLRSVNSWVLKLDQVETPELLEVFTINTLAPFVLNSRLVPFMRTAAATPRFIVNVTAMEGKFYRYKTPNHPHTNMAKAALNMMTRTCAPDLAKPGSDIYMTSVDTGWINDENPLPTAAATAARSNFQTPIDEVDAASRVLDPILDFLPEMATDAGTGSSSSSDNSGSSEKGSAAGAQTGQKGKKDERRPPFAVVFKDYHIDEW